MKLKDAVYGFAVGDALGVPYEFKERGTFKCKDMIGGGTWNQLPGTWSDDTSMLLATCDSIRERGGVDPIDIMYKFLQWHEGALYTARGDVFDVGATTQRAIIKYKEGAFPLSCGDTDILSNGNGSLMRILPLAFVDADEETICDVSSLTHAHKLSVNCCGIYVSIAKELINDKNYKIPSGFTFKKKKEIKSSGYVLDSLNAALWCVGTSHSYSETVLKAVNLGGDTDTIAALSGGLAGIKYGYDAIPEKWIDRLANKELIEKCLFTV